MNGCQFLNLTFLLGAIANLIPEVHIIRSVIKHVSILHYRKQDLRMVQFLFENTKFESDIGESLLKIAIESNEKIGIKQTIVIFCQSLQNIFQQSIRKWNT